MPLVAMVGEARIVSTFLDGNAWDGLRRQSRDGLLTLAGCGSRAYLRRSPAGMQHFAHQPGSSPCDSHVGESPAHLRAKAAIVEAARAAGWDAEPEVPGDGYVADVLAWHEGDRRVVFEVQLAAQADTDYRDRTSVRADSGAETVWLARVPEPRSSFASANPLLHPDPTMPLARITETPDGGLRVQAGNSSLTLAEFVDLYLAEHIVVRANVTGDVTTRINMLRHECWKCGHECTVWEVAGREVTGPCGAIATDGDGHGHGAMWAKEKPEGQIRVKRAVALRCNELNWAPPAGLSTRYTRTTGSEYLAFTCPTCDAVFGDWPLREAWMEAAYEDEQTDGTSIPEADDHLAMSHWCRDAGAGVCTA